MRLALSTRGFAPGLSASAVAALLERLGVDLVHVWTPPAGEDPRRWVSLRPARIGVSSVATSESFGAADGGDGFARTLAASTEIAAATRAETIVVEGGGDPGEGARERAVVAAMRALHGALGAGAPLSLRNGGPGALLGFSETGHALADSRRLALWFDPARAHARHRAGLGPPAVAWADAHAGRMSGIHVEGLPVEGDLDWPALARVLPRRVPWVVELAPAAPERDLRRAVDHVRSLGR